jgi:hypothetical protein
MLAQSPCRRVPLPKAEREEMRFLTPAQVAALAAAITPRYRALVLVGAYGGLRIGELAGLRRRRVDLLRGSVQVAEIVVEVRGILHVGRPRPEPAGAPSGWPRFVVEELAAHLARPGDLEALVFRAPQGGPLRLPAFRGRVWRPAVIAAGLDGLRSTTRSPGWKAATISARSPGDSGTRVVRCGVSSSPPSLAMRSKGRSSAKPMLNSRAVEAFSSRNRTRWWRTFRWGSWVPLTSISAPSRPIGLKAGSPKCSCPSPVNRLSWRMTGMSSMP